MFPFAIVLNENVLPIAFATITSPTATASITDGAGGFTALDGARGITTVVIGSSTYALVTSQTDDGVQIIDITNPSSPTATAAITDESGGFTALNGPRIITTVVIGSSTYALVASFEDDGVQIINISTPSSPTATATFLESDDAANRELDGAFGITTVVIGSSTYALVASQTDSGVQIIDITNPSSPTATAAITDESGGFTALSGAFGITTVVIGSSTYALVASGIDDGVQIINISTPSSPTATATFLESNDAANRELDGAQDITTVVIGSSTYALVASFDDDGVQIIDITTPGSPTATAAITDGVGGFTELDGARGITIRAIDSSTYALVASFDDDGMQIINISTPRSPTATAAITDESGGFTELDAAAGITTVVIGSSTYALVASVTDDGVQIIDISAVIAPTSSGGGPKGDISAPSFSLDKFTFSRLFPESVLDTIQDDPYTPIETIKDETLALPLVINDNGYAISNHANTIHTNTIQTGAPAIIKLNLSDETGIEHVVLYTNLRGEKREVQDSDTYIIFDEHKELEIIDPHGFFYFANVTVHKNNTKYIVSYNVTFAKPIEKSDIIFRIWDDRRNAADTKIFDAWKIVGEDLTKEQFSLLLAEPAVKETESSEFALFDDEKSIVLDKWAGYYAESSVDSEVLKALGMEGSHIPHWVKKFFGESIHNGQLEIKDLKLALEYLSKIGIVQ